MRCLDCGFSFKNRHASSLEEKTVSEGIGLKITSKKLLLRLAGVLGIAALVATCGIQHGGERRLASEQFGSNDDYGNLTFGGTPLPDSVLPTQKYVDVAYATVDPSDLLLIDILIDDSVSQEKKQNLATSLPEILKEVINSNWWVEVRSMSNLNATSFASVYKYADTFTYKDILKQGVEKFAPAVSRRNIADRSLRLPVYVLISGSDLPNDVQQNLDKYIAKDPRRRVFALVDKDAEDSFLGWRDSDNGKKMVDYAADLNIDDLKAVLQEFSGYIADTLRSNFHLHGFCEGTHRDASGNIHHRHSGYEREPRTMAVELLYHSSERGYLNASSYHLTEVDDSLFIKDTLTDGVCIEASYVYKTYPDNQQICRNMH